MMYLNFYLILCAFNAAATGYLLKTTKDRPEYKEQWDELEERWEQLTEVLPLPVILFVLFMFSIQRLDIILSLFSV